MTTQESKEIFKQGVKVKDRFKQNNDEGEVILVLKTRIRVQFKHDSYDTTYDWAHVRICLTKIQ